MSGRQIIKGIRLTIERRLQRRQREVLAIHGVVRRRAFRMAALEHVEAQSRIIGPELRRVPSAARMKGDQVSAPIARRIARCRCPAATLSSGRPTLAETVKRIHRRRHLIPPFGCGRAHNFRAQVRTPSLLVGTLINAGGSGWARNRTGDTRIFNPLLYQLSYPALLSFYGISAGGFRYSSRTWLSSASHESRGKI